LGKLFFLDHAAFSHKKCVAIFFQRKVEFFEDTVSVANFEMIFSGAHLDLLEVGRPCVELLEARVEVCIASG